MPANTLAFRPFEDRDWGDYPGCESDSPLIASIGEHNEAKVSDNGLTATLPPGYDVVVDGKDVVVFVYRTDEHERFEHLSYAYYGPSEEEALAVGHKVLAIADPAKPAPNIAKLLKMGFVVE